MRCMNCACNDRSDSVTCANWPDTLTKETLTIRRTKMRHDLFDFCADMSAFSRGWRIALLLVLIAVCLLDLFYWRPHG